MQCGGVDQVEHVIVNAIKQVRPNENLQVNMISRGFLLLQNFLILLSCLKRFGYMYVFCWCILIFDLMGIRFSEATKCDIRIRRNTSDRNRRKFW